MRRVVALIRPFQLEPVKSAIAAYGVCGLNIIDVRVSSPGDGDKRGLGSAFVPMPIKTRLEAVVQDEQVEDLIQIICEHATTESADDGLLFVQDVEDVIRIRTGERGLTAL